MVAFIAHFVTVRPGGPSGPLMTNYDMKMEIADINKVILMLTIFYLIKFVCFFHHICISGQSWKVAFFG